MKREKELKYNIVKTKGGYSVYNPEKQDSIDLFNDDNTGRAAFIKFLCDQILNKEVRGGRKYK